MNQEKINEICDKGKMILCYDLDDTLIDFATQTPFYDRITEMKIRKKEGHYIIVQTARQKISREETEKQLRDWGIPFDEFLYGHKPKAHIYIDDSAVNADDYFNNPSKFLKIFHAIGFRINYLIRHKGGLK